ncbi:MAG: 16S rRNA (cytosine(1402)-N(4))-methyltransferase RsmH [Clostridiaceae bacterium]|nr:16S rRNA (cytosine(1402)-N(4))-methyltransferase RsmH [Clostridiaceae bacterium]
MYKDSNYHLPVLYREAIETLSIKPNGVYVDCTAGGGGHSSGIIKRLNENGFLLAIDQDPEALLVTRKKLESLRDIKAQYILVQDQFSNIKEILANSNITKIDGLIADLGVSSYQIDTASRGFSFQQDGKLDMRMNPKSKMSAFDFVNNASQEKIAEVLRKYGEEKFANRISSNIVFQRSQKTIRTTYELVQIIKQVMPARSRREQHPAKRTFQAIRIYVNQELAEIEKLLDALPDCMASGGIIDIISFHSLEDRIVKRIFQKWENPCTCPPDFPVCTCNKKPLGKRVNTKGFVASQEEINRNPRSRSARLRVFKMN